MNWKNAQGQVWIYKCPEPITRIRRAVSFRASQLCKAFFPCTIVYGDRVIIFEIYNQKKKIWSHGETEYETMIKFYHGTQSLSTYEMELDKFIKRFRRFT